MEVINVKAVGGRGEAERRGYVYVGRPSPLGNPFTHLAGVRGTSQVGSRNEAVEMYRRWLWERIQAGDQDVLRELRRVAAAGFKVACWCAPLRCHGEVVVKAAAWLARRDGV